jgi:hypothetical protein
MCSQHRRGNPGSTFEKFERGGKASFQHHCWNNHEFCGDWCQAKFWNKEEKERLKHKYRNRDTHEKEYQQQYLVFLKKLSSERMWRAYHKWCNNKTEQIHGLIVNTFMHKRSYFCRTICGKARTYLGVSINSLGFLEYYRLLYYLELGMEMSSITEGFYRHHDNRRSNDCLYAKSPVRRKIRAKQR